jgi:hypothetical protein
MNSGIKAVLFILFFLPNLVFSHGDHSTHQHNDSPGGPLLNGYPWGIFSSSTQFEKRVDHKKNDQELALANKIFEFLAKYDVVAFPLKLDHQYYRPLGDGQSNAEASLGWDKQDPLLMAGLSRSHQTVEFFFHQDVIKTNLKILVRFPNGKVTELEINHDQRFSLPVNVSDLGWDTMSSGKMIFVKPKQDYDDWFAIKFQQANHDVHDVVEKVPTNLSKNIPNPLKINASTSTPPLLQLMQKAEASNYKVHATDLVHSIYPNLDHPNFVHKASGGNWTFILNKEMWDHLSLKKETFKQLYSCFEGRAYWEESTRKSVSGTGWHHVGDQGEIILNSIQDETRSLVAAIAEPFIKPNDIKLSYDLNYIGYASLVKPNQAFVTAQGQYHWHPVHTPEPICVEVWAPECKPSETNGFGFQCP